MHLKTLSELAKDLQAGQISSVELTTIFLERTSSFDKTLNAFISIDREGALASAKLADELRANGKAGPLTGLPIAHKDIFCTEGLRTSCGSKMLDNFIPPYDATVVKKLKASGVVTIGKTNMDEFAMGSSNETSYYGTVKNPWDLTRVPGGSSGGSAAAVSARLAPAATGTDTGGSIRQPAALCGVTGLKPTYGRVSRYGMIAFASSLDQAGPMAQSAEDCALLFSAMSGFDERDSTSISHASDNIALDLNQSLDGLTVGLPKEYFGEGLDGNVGKRVDAAIEEYKKLGANFVEISLPNQELAVPVYYVVAPAECSSNLSRFDGVRFGHRCKNPVDLEDMYKRSRGEGFGPEVKRRIMIGTYVLSAGFYDAYYIKAQQLRNLISEDFNQAFKKVDLILGPTTPAPAFKLGEKFSDPVSMYLNDIYTIAANLAGLPGISIPCGFADGLPVGLQLLAPAFMESRLLSAAHQYQQVTDWHRQMPAAFE